MRHHLWHSVFAVLAGLGLTAQAEPSLPDPRPWTNYHVIMWVGDSAAKHPAQWPGFFDRLREMGVTAGMAYGGEGDAAPAVKAGFPYYVENVVNRGLCLKWNSKIKDWDPFVTEWAKTRDPAALVREPSLDDPQWLGWARGQMATAARHHGTHQPLAYNIRDELSVTWSANPFDFDFSPAALAGFRTWLRTQYPSVEALNTEWAAKFASFDEALPFTTDQIKNRLASGDAQPRGKPDWQALQQIKFDARTAAQKPVRWNFAPWADFRTYMDLSLTRALDSLRQAARAVDPATPVGIEGTQMPHAFGGYDLARLASALDWVEPYDIGNAREIFGSFMPGKPILTTVFEKETDPARRRLWHLLLEGDRGCLIWWSEDCLSWADNDWRLTPKAKALAPVLRELTSPLAALFLRASREFDPVYLHYSQPSVQVAWMLESCPDGSTWLRRFSSFEAEHNRQARVRNAWLKALQDLGYSPRFVTGNLLSSPLIQAHPGALVLPNSLAMSDTEVAAVAQYVDSKDSVRVVLADGTPGLFNDHGRLRAANPWQERLPLLNSGEAALAVASPAKPPARREGDIGDYVRQRLEAKPNLQWAEWVGAQLKPLPPPVRVPLEARARVHRYGLGRARLVAIERNIDYHMSEDLSQKGGNQALEVPLDTKAEWTDAVHVYDLRRMAYLGHATSVSFRLDPWQPSLFALLPERVPDAEVLAWLQRQADEKGDQASR